MGGDWESGYVPSGMEVFQYCNEHGCTGVYRLNVTLYVYGVYWVAMKNVLHTACLGQESSKNTDSRDKFLPQPKTGF